LDENKNVIKIFIEHLSTTFIATIMVITLTGMWTVDATGVYDGLFRLSEGLAFEGIVQIFIWSCIISALVTALTSDIWFSKIMLLWRVVALMFLAVAVSVGFAIVFRWFPLDAWEAWVTFLVFFIVGFGGGLVAMVAKTKIEDRRYNKLLSEYKSKRGRNHDE
jgi:MFS family permease